MENFDWTQFTRKIAVRGIVTTFYDAWTKSFEIEKWFLSEARYFSPNKNVIDKNAHIQKGDTYEWNWYLFDQTEYGMITEANGIDHLQFTFAGDCPVDIHLSQKEDHVIVELTQSNIPTDNNSKQGIRLGCDTGWCFYLANLKSVYEGGIDLRNKDGRFLGMVNM